jgi:hypothetical protein
MTEAITMFYLVKNGKVLFGPRRYYKPAYEKACANLELELDLPGSVELSTELGGGYWLIHEADLAEATKQVEEPVVEVAKVSTVAEVAEEPVDDDEVVEEVVKVTRKKK